MKAGNILGNVCIPWKPTPPPRLPPPLSTFRCFSASPSSSSLKTKMKPKRDWAADWISNNDDTLPVADASSSQSRADLLTLGLAVTNMLTGLVWLTIRPKSISVVNPQGVECWFICSHLPDFVFSELLWAWESLSGVTRCRSLVVVYDCRCILQIGVAAESVNNEALAVDAAKLMQGSLYQAAIKSASQSYLANLSLYPGRSELPFLPLNTQAVILQPLADKGIVIIGGDTIRGFTSSDQAWITLIGEKLDASLAKYVTNEL
ncbi:hypothetical protein OIU74_022935 [Salix koriyanagi]|uniref:Protein COFACTOR ASSEMBLY OF COMPLEX C SUBUNIT B CCB4, chloroplastic n=1 Tax=Salix koriyanagi TaxID=2511006 RepID=A0A9Q1AFP4_9ROSI|nr:hypothetical protein OIU74_022935 [Salix koriyanagi]